MSTRRASKRKVACDGDERVISKKACLSDNAKLTKAVDNSDILAVRDILEKEDRNLSRWCLHAALLKAVEEGKKKIVQLLLSHGVCVRGKSKTGCLALIAAAKHGYFDIVKLLIKKGAPVNSKDSTGKTALMAAVEKSCCSALILLLLEDCEADINLQDNAGKTALMLAVEQWDYETVEIFFIGDGHDTTYNCDEGIKDNDGRTALDLAKMNGSAELLNLLSESRREMLPPLSVAAGWNNLDLVRRIVEISPSGVERPDFGEAPLTAAMHGLEGDQDLWDGKIHCSFELMDFLLQAGVDVNDCHLCGHTPLMFAASAGSDRAVKMLLQYKAEVNYTAYPFEVAALTDQGPLKCRTALMLAAQKGYTSIVKMLIEAGSHLYFKDVDGDNALDLAIKGGHKACIQALLKKWKSLTDHDIELMEEHKELDVLIDVKDRLDQLLEDPKDPKDPQLRQTVLCKAIKARSYPVVKALVENGTDVNFIHNYDVYYDEDVEHGELLCPILLALDDIDMLALIMNTGADINFRLGDKGFTPLTYAALIGNETQVRNVLKYNADMYAELHGRSALTLADLRGKTETVTALLDGGMDVNHVFENKQTPLWNAVSEKTYDLAETLIKRGANVNFANDRGFTVLMHALTLYGGDSSNLSELLIKSGADVNAQDDYGETPLFYAIKRRQTRENIVSLLLQHGADMNYVNLSLKTPLMVAVEHRLDIDVLKVLLATEPEVNAQDINGDTALHIAVTSSYDYEESVNMLVSSGADINIVNTEYRSPLMAALKTVNQTAVNSLLGFGASPNVQSSPGVSQTWKSDLDRLLRRFCSYDSDLYCFFDFMKCVEALLKAGCSLHKAQPSNLDKFFCACINEDEFQIVRMLVKSGCGPNPICLTCLPGSFERSFMINAASICNLNVSPMCIAILVHSPKIIKLFAQACFYHQEDIKMLQHPRIVEKLETLFLNSHHTHPSLLEELCPKNWSLRTWSKLAVLRAVGFGEDREQRVRALPIPQGLRDELLYKNISGIE